MQSIHSNQSEASPRSNDETGRVITPRGWRALLRLWCEHRRTSITPRTDDMPAHVVCESCGWREPVTASIPRAVRTWDSTRDQERYEREKERRAAAEEKKRLAIAQLATPEPTETKPRRRKRGNVVELRGAIAR